MTSDHFMTLDETVRAIKAEYEEKLTAMKDKLMAAEIEATMAKSGMAEARAAQAQAERITTKLLTQFGLVAKVFEEARELALKLEPPKVTALPENEWPGGMTVISPEIKAHHLDGGEANGNP